MANLTIKDLDALEKKFEARKSYGQWEAFEDTIHFTTWDHPTEPLLRDPDFEGVGVSDVDAEYTCVAALAYRNDTEFIAAVNNAFPQLLAMARIALTYQEDMYESLLFDAFVYRVQDDRVGIQSLHTVADLAKELGKPNEWVDEVFRVMTEVHSGMVSDDAEEFETPEEALHDAWGGDFPSTIEEAISQSMSLK